MDKRTIIGFILIGLVIILYPVYMEWITGGKEAQRAPLQPRTEADSVAPPPELAQERGDVPVIPEAALDTAGLVPADTLPEARIVTVETDLYSAQGYEMLSAGLSGATNGFWQVEDADKGLGVLDFAGKGSLWKKRRSLARNFWAD